MSNINIAGAGGGGGGTIAIGTTPITGGVDTRVLFQQGTTVGESAGLTFDYTNQLLAVGGAGHTDPNGNVALAIKGLHDTDLVNITDGTRQFGIYVGANSFATGVGGVLFETLTNDPFGFGINNGAPNLVINANNTVVIGANPTNTPSGLFVYNIYSLPITSPPNYERGIFDFTTAANVLTIGTQKGGTGSSRNINFVVDTSSAALFDNIGVFTLSTGATKTLAIGNGGNNALFGGIWFNFPETFTNYAFLNNAGLATLFNDAAQLEFRIANNTQFHITSLNTRVSGDSVLGFASNSAGAGDLLAADTAFSRIPPVSSVPTIAIGNGTLADASGTIKAKTKAGAPLATDVPAGTWVLIRDTTNNTTKMYYNNAGTLQSVALV
jgi:hypothetical protein